MITWSQIIFQEAYPNQGLKEKNSVIRVVTLLSEGGGPNASVLDYHVQGRLTQFLCPCRLEPVSLGWPILIVWAKFRFLITCGELPSAFWELHLGWVLGRFLSLCLFLPCSSWRRLSLFSPLIQMLFICTAYVPLSSLGFPSSLHGRDTQVLHSVPLM